MKNKGITLVALVITIIILLILAGITIAGLTGSGLFENARLAKTKTMLANAQEEVQLALSTLMTEKYLNNIDITPKMISDEVNSSSERETYAENETTFPTSIIYPTQDTGIDEEIQVKVGENLEIIEVKTVSGITNNNSGTSSSGGSFGTGEIVEVGNVNITITNVKARSFTINVEAENADNIAMYQYYVDGELIYEGTEPQYTVTKLQMNTNYEVEVKAIPKTTVSIGKVQQKTIEAPIIEIASKFDKTIYIDSVNGDDTTGDGSKGNPYATLNKITETGIIENDYTYGIVLKNGEYQLTEGIFALNCNKSIHIIGNRENTILNVNGIYSNSTGGSTNYTVNIYRLIWDGNDYSNHNAISPINNINLNAVVFRNIQTDGWTSYFESKSSSTINIINCTSEKSVPAMLRTDAGTIKLTNCYGGFTSGYNTSDSSWNYQTNYITSTPSVDATTYQITEDESLWKDVGTGIDSDGSVADLGVYGGEYSWSFETDVDN